MGDVLLIEDDDEVAAVTERALREMGFQSERARDGERGLERALQGSFELILLDLGLPKLEGSDVCKSIREHDASTPIIVLSLSAEVLSRVLLLELGADDYLTKPFAVSELKARIRAVLRRASRESSSEVEANENFYRSKGLYIDFLKRKVTRDNRVIELTATEFDILALLASQPGRPFTRSELNLELHGSDLENYQKSISNHINRIRTKLEPKIENPIYILTIRGVGYALSDA